MAMLVENLSEHAVVAGSVHVSWSWQQRRNRVDPVVLTGFELLQRVAWAQQFCALVVSYEGEQ